MLKAGLKERGIQCKALYASVFFIKEVGFSLLREFSNLAHDRLLLERVFAPFAHESIQEMNLGGRVNHTSPDLLRICYTYGDSKRDISPEEYALLQSRCKSFLKKMTEIVVSHRPKIIGFSNAFPSINALIALAKEIRKRLPDSIYVIGGTNCDGEIGVEIANSVEVFDYVFQGEADSAFPEFCHDYLENDVLPSTKLIDCGLQHDLDMVPIPDHGDFLEQCDMPIREISLSFESSRGCWWGQKRQCKFCGESKASNGFRFKSTERMYNELLQTQRRCPDVKTFFSADSIMPNEYFNTLFPRLSDSLFNKHLVYHTRSNLNYRQLFQMKQAGIKTIFVGIESLSTRLLTIINKGTNALTCVRLLRDCRELDIAVFWSMLVGIPGDHGSDYEEQLRVIPFIQHLCPTHMCPIRLDRFSPYYVDPEAYEIEDVKPLSDYHYAFPESIDMTKMAYYFEGEYPSASREQPEILLPLKQQMDRWMERWMKDDIPELSLKWSHSKGYVVKDTRDCAKTATQVLDNEDHSLLKQCRVGLSLKKTRPDTRMNRFLDLGFLIELDGRVLSLVCELGREQGEGSSSKPI